MSSRSDSGRTRDVTSDAQDAESAVPADQTPAPDDGISGAFQDPDGGTGLPPRGPGEEEPRALSGDGVDVVPLADGDTATVGGTTADRPEQDRPMGTDADDRLRDLDDDEEDGT
jgi:hypothetical protein